MKSIPLAFTWELYRRGRWLIPASLLGANLFPVLMLTTLSRGRPIDLHEPEFIILHMAGAQISLVIFAVGVFSASQEMLPKLAPWPVTNWALAFWRLVPLTLTVFAGSLGSLTALNALYGINWPALGPALSAAAAVALAQALIWLTEKTGWEFWALTLEVLGLGGWFKARYGGCFSQPDHFWIEVTPAEAATLLAVLCGAVVIGQSGVARQRCGELLPQITFFSWLQRLIEPLALRQPVLRSPQQAQLWWEWNRKGWALPAAMAEGVVIGGLLWLAFSRDLPVLVDGLALGGVLLMLGGGMIGALFIGNFGVSETSFQMRSFLATRPLTTPDLARILLTMTAQSVLLAWVLWVVAAGAILGLVHLSGAWPQSQLMEGLRWWYVPATLLGGWTTAALGASLMATGRNKLVLGLLIATFIVLISGELSLKLLTPSVLSDAVGNAIVHGFLTASAIALILTGAGLHILAWRRNMTSPATLLAAGSAWLLLTSVILVERARHPSEPLTTYLLVIAAAALCVTPPAAAPLALAWNRNR